MQAGDTIGQEQADALLASRLERDGAWLAHRIPGWAALSSHQQAALLSFSYNCCPNWFGSEGFATLSRCTQQGRTRAGAGGAAALRVPPAGSLSNLDEGAPAQ